MSGGQSFGSGRFVQTVVTSTGPSQHYYFDVLIDCTSIDSGATAVCLAIHGFEEQNTRQSWNGSVQQ